MGYARKWDLQKLINSNYNINAVIARIIKTKNSDLYEKLPAMFAIGMNKKLLNIKEIFKYTKNTTYENYLIKILTICIATYIYFNMRFNIIDELYEDLGTEERNEIKLIINKIRKNDCLDIYKVSISTKQIQEFINLYVKPT